MPKRIFTDEVYALIPQLVAQNLPADAIAGRIGCTVSSLKVMCSKHNISLRTPDWKQRSLATRIARGTAKPKPAPKPKPIRLEPVKPKRRLFTMESSLVLSRVAMSRLRQRAETMNITDAELATQLLEVIAQDDLYNAVLGAEEKKAA